MADLEGFDWDAANVGHILRHRVTPFEVEEAVGRPHVTIVAKTIEGEKRWFTIRRRLFRTVTAYEMNATERRKYAPQIDERF